MQLRQLCCFWLSAPSPDTFLFCVLTLRLLASTPANLIKIILLNVLSGKDLGSRRPRGKLLLPPEELPMNVCVLLMIFKFRFHVLKKERYNKIIKKLLGKKEWNRPI